MKLLLMCTHAPCLVLAGTTGTVLHAKPFAAAYTNCISEVSAMPKGILEYSAPTFGCRQYHLINAMKTTAGEHPRVHCPHASPDGTLASTVAATHHSVFVALSATELMG